MLPDELLISLLGEQISKMHRETGKTIALMKSGITIFQLTTEENRNRFE